MTEWRLYIEDIKVWSWTQGRSFMTNLFQQKLSGHSSFDILKTSKMINVRETSSQDWRKGHFVHLEHTLELLGILKGSTMAKFLILIARDFTQNWRHWLKMNGKRIVQQSKISKGGECRGEDEIYHCVTSVGRGRRIDVTSTTKHHWAPTPTSPTVTCPVSNFSKISYQVYFRS